MPGRRNALRVQGYQVELKISADTTDYFQSLLPRERIKEKSDKIIYPFKGALR